MPVTAGARRTLGGRYELHDVIGRGGMGVVYGATDRVLEREVAVKVLPALLAEERPEHIQRFEREARTAASLNHPAIVSVYDTGIEEATRFIVMERVSGSSLASVMRERAPLDPARAAEIAAGVADALAAAHAAGLVHRDVKPANVMIAADGSVKVLDFGIAKTLDATALTREAQVLGSAAYMAPEQALGQRVDERSDIYSLGCLLYAMLTGHPPFTGDAASLVHQQVNSRPHPPRASSSAVPRSLDALTMAMLAKSPADRPQRAAHVRAQLSQLNVSSAAAPAVGAAAARAAGAADPTAVTRVLRAPARASRRPTTKLAAAAALALLLGAILALAVAAGSGSGGKPKAARRAASAPRHTSSAPAPASTPTATPTTSQAVSSAPPAAPAAPAQPPAGPVAGPAPPGPVKLKPGHPGDSPRAPKHPHGHHGGPGGPPGA